MKNKHFVYSALCALMLSGTMFTSCDNDDDKKSEEKTTDDIVNQIPAVDGSKQLTPDEQKSHLDQVGKAFMTEFQSTNFDNLIDLVNYAYEKYGEDYDWDNVESWADDAYETLVKNEKGKTLVDEWEREQEDIVDKYEQTFETVIYRYLEYEDITEVIYTASAFTGHFVAENGKWTQTAADDLQFSFSDQNGKPCVLSVTTSGKTVSAFFGDNFKGDDWNSKINDDGSHTSEYIDIIDKIIVAVPEHITVTLTQDGKEVIKSEINTNLSVASSTEYDFSKDKFNVTTTTTIDGYTFEVSKASFSNQDKKAESTFKLKKGDVKLLEYSIKANGEITNDDGDYDVNTLDTEISIDILGKVQIKGTSKDGGKLMDLLDEAEENDDNETVYKEKIAAANALINYGMYFDGGDTKQLEVVMEPFEEETWGGKTYWDYDLLIQFADGTKNAFDDFFIKANFYNVNNLWDDMSDDYENKIKVD